MSRLVGWLVVLAAVGGGVWWLLPSSGDAAPKVTYRTAKVERGEVVEGVAASGTIQPVELIEVGTQISGVVQELRADFNSKVTAGETIAVLDSRRLVQQVAQDEASVARARADVERAKAAADQARTDVDRLRAARSQAEADVARVQALIVQAAKDLERKAALAAKRLASQADVEQAEATKGSLDAQFASARAALPLNDAQVASAEAAVRQSDAQVKVSEAAVLQAEAQLASDRVNLGYATIVSPVDGVVVSRSVDVGQTVAASLSAPTLFTIARDLTKVQVETAVPEADVGRVHEKQPVRFTVDAHPEKTFDGTVTQIRLAATTVQNVVTYTVIVDATNPDGLLLPGMTANVTFEVARSVKDALKVPSTALRLQAPADLVAAGADGAADGHGDGALPRRGTAEGGSPPRASGESGGLPRGGGRRARSQVYVQTADGRLRAVPVRPGISDGISTVVEPLSPDALPEGTEVVTSVLRLDDTATSSPFAMPRMGAPRSSGGGR